MPLIEYRWSALLNNDPSKSTRRDIYYGITDSAVGIYGPALRTVDGMKIIIGGWVSWYAVALSRFALLLSENMLVSPHRCMSCMALRHIGWRQRPVQATE